MPRKRRPTAAAVADPTVAATTVQPFQADVLAEVEADWEALSRECGVAVEAPTDYVKTVWPHDLRRKPRYAAALSVAGEELGKAELSELDGGEELDHLERHLLDKLLTKTRANLLDKDRPDPGLLSRLRAPKVKAAKAQLKKAWQRRDVEGVAEVLSKDPLWLSLVLPATAKANLDGVLRLARRLILSVEARSPDTKDGLKELGASLDRVAATATAAFAAAAAKDPKGLLAGADADQIQPITTAFITSIHVAGQLASMAHGGWGEDQVQLHSDLMGQLKGVRTVLEGALGGEEEEREEEEAEAPVPGPADAVYSAPTSRAPSPDASRAASPTLGPAPKKKPCLKAPSVGIPEDGLVFRGLMEMEGEYRRFAYHAEEIKTAANNAGVHLRHCRPTAELTAVKHSKTDLVFGSERRDGKALESVTGLLEELLARPILPSALPTDEAVLATFQALRHFAPEERPAVEEHGEAPAPDDESPDEPPSNLRWRLDDMRDVPVVDFSYTGSNVNICLEPPGPGMSVERNVGVLLKSGRSGRFVVALLGVLAPPRRHTASPASLPSTASSAQDTPLSNLTFKGVDVTHIPEEGKRPETTMCRVHRGSHIGSAFKPNEESRVKIHYFFHVDVSSEELEAETSGGAYEEYIAFGACDEELLPEDLYHDIFQEDLDLDACAAWIAEKSKIPGGPVDVIFSRVGFGGAADGSGTDFPSMENLKPIPDHIFEDSEEESEDEEETEEGEEPSELFSPSASPNNNASTSSLTITPSPRPRTPPLKGRLDSTLDSTPHSSLNNTNDTTPNTPGRFGPH